MSEAKCPLCSGDLIQSKEFPCFYSCQSTNWKSDADKLCELDDCAASVPVWEALRRTRKVLEQSEICCTEWEKQALDYKAENIALSGDLERTRKVLDVAVDALKIIGSGKVIEHSVMFHEDDNKIFIANKDLEQITALEQKD